MFPAGYDPGDDYTAIFCTEWHYFLDCSQLRANPPNELISPVRCWTRRTAELLVECLNSINTYFHAADFSSMRLEISSIVFRYSCSRSML